MVYEKDKLLKTYKISLGHNPVGKKEFEETYNKNKWLVPINKELNLELP